MNLIYKYFEDLTQNLVGSSQRNSILLPLLPKEHSVKLEDSLESKRELSKDSLKQQDSLEPTHEHSEDSLKKK